MGNFEPVPNFSFLNDWEEPVVSKERKSFEKRIG